eukprot:UN5098
MPRALTELTLHCCGLHGTLDCSSLAGLRCLWLFGNDFLSEVRGSGQPLRTLNVGSTSCFSIAASGFNLGSVRALDIADMDPDDAALRPLLTSCACTAECVVLGGNLPSSALLTDFMEAATHLKRLNIARCPCEAATVLTAAVGMSVLAPSLEEVELMHGSGDDLIQEILHRRPQLEVSRVLDAHDEPASPAAFGELHLGGLH